MKSIREFEVWSLPGSQLDSEYGKNTLQREMWDAGVPRDVFLGVSVIPDVVDCNNLEAAIQSGEFTEKDFQEFCLKNELPYAHDSEESSARFLEYTRGRCLAWIHLPDDAAPFS